MSEPTTQRRNGILVWAAITSCVIGLGVASFYAFNYVTSYVEAQQYYQVLPNGVIVSRSYKNDRSIPLRDMTPVPNRRLGQQESSPNPKVPNRHVDGPDPVVQDSFFSAPGMQMPAPIVNADGIVYPGVGCNCAPPDTIGEVGFTQYVQMVNEGIQVFNKTTGASVLGPVGIQTIWSGFGGACENFGFGDPIVLYDQQANRWLVSQFASPTNSIPFTDECIAISTTSDATGSWYRYGFTLGPNFYDYPHFGMFPNAYYMAENVFNAAATAYLGTQAFAFDRTKMLAGLPASFVSLGITTGGATRAPFLPADMDGATTPAVNAPGIFVETPFTNTYRIYHMAPDFVTPANTTLTLVASPAAAAFTFQGSDVPQLGTTSLLDSLADRVMNRMAYRNMGTSERIVGNMTVSSNNVSGVRWFELNKTGVSTYTVNQESTYQPDLTHRWMASVAQDHHGNMALGYSASSSTINPQIRYAGRLVTDPASTLPQAEVSLHNGTGSQVGTFSRWGDYSSMTVDPVDDCTFWYTQEYYSTTASFAWRTRFGNFKYPTCVPYSGAMFDPDHDGRTDSTIYRTSNNVFYIAGTGGGTSIAGPTPAVAGTSTKWGVPGDIDVMGDYDGDGKADIAVWRPSTGAWFIIQSLTNTVRVTVWGTAGDIPMPGDVDGDQKDDLVIYRPNAGAWFALKSGGGIDAVGWGIATDQPLLADFDGDGKLDYTIYRASNGVWYIRKSAGGTTIIGWGTGTDIPVAGDWDGDHKADQGVFRPGTGQWLINRSTGGVLAATWGVAGDIPISGDQDGDQRSDFTIFRNGNWFTRFAAGGTKVVGWGIAGDKPTGRVPGS